MNFYGPVYEHMDNHGIVSLIFENTKKEADKGVEDKNDLPKHLSVHSLTLKPCRKWMIT